MTSEDAKILEFNQFQKSDKHHLLFMQILSVYQKRIMDTKIILKIHLQQKYAYSIRFFNVYNIFF